MAVTQTGTIYKAFSFDNVSSRDYGVYITGEAVYNAPERDVEMISIPGRNGTFALDNGRFENIEVKYPAGIFADNETDFAQGISDFRNYLCSRKGYVRLTDEYNPDEYRLAVYKSGLEVTSAQLKVGEFEIIFDCMPQRFLLSGEDKITVTGGETLTNPTLFESSPMLEAKGYGTVYINDASVTIDNVNSGDVRIAIGREAWALTLNDKFYQNGDAIYGIYLTPESQYRYIAKPIFNILPIGGYAASGSNRISAWLGEPDHFVAGTPKTATLSSTQSGQVWATSDPNTKYTYNLSYTFSLIYDGDKTFTAAIETTLTGNGRGLMQVKNKKNTFYDVYTDSTIAGPGDPTYIDLDIGEAYKYMDGEIFPLNNIVSLPAELPVLVSGENTVTASNTITELKVAPRWWKV